MKSSLSIVAIGLIVFPSILFAAINLEAECSGSTATLSVNALNTYGAEYVGFVITRQSIGLCEEELVVTPDPLPLPPFSTSPPPAADDWEMQVVDVAIPYSNVNFKFQAWLVDSEGERFSVPSDPGYGPYVSAVDYTSNGDAPIMRGSLVGFPCSTEGYYNIFVTPCEEGCWGIPELTIIAECVEAESLLYESCFQGTVDLVGRPVEPNGMSTPLMVYLLTSIIPSPGGGCGLVPASTTTFGGLKARYR